MPGSASLRVAAGGGGCRTDPLPIRKARNWQASTVRLHMRTTYGAIRYGVIVDLVYVGTGGGEQCTDLVLDGCRLPVFGTALSGHVVTRESLVWALSGAFPIRSGEGFFLVTYLATHASSAPDAPLSLVVSASGLLDRAAGMLTAMWTGLSLELFAGATTIFAIGGLGLLPAGDDYRLAALASAMAPRNSTIVWAPR